MSKRTSLNGVLRSKKHRKRLAEILEPEWGLGMGLLDGARCLSAGKYARQFEHVEVEVRTLANGKTVELNPTLVDRSLTKKEGVRGLLVGQSPARSRGVFSKVVWGRHTMKGGKAVWGKHTKVTGEWDENS